MSAPPQPVAGAVRRWERVVWQAHIVRVLAGTQFKLRYADSVLGYFWSLARPLALFAILYAVFGRALRFDGVVENYALFLLLGIVLFYFFSDATSRTLISIVEQGPLLRRVAFPRLIVPFSVTETAFLTFAMNLVAITAFLAWRRITPEVEWLLLVPLFVELNIFVLGVSLLLATLYVRFRDIAVIWELALRVCFYSLAIIYPVQLLPSWAEKAVLVVPFAQVMQDVRAVILPGSDVVTIADVLGGPTARLIPIGVSLALFALSVLIFRREEPWFAEKV
jgi:ABC-2 type transport system permease protein